VAPLDAFLTLAAELADAAGAAIRPYFRTRLAIDDKADLSPVTAADRAAEAAMRQLIEARFPDHGIIGEEYGPDRRHQILYQRGTAVWHPDSAGPERAANPRDHRPADLA
jgi:fructose-1,6-bisphosphatase/inositol monophosphatase family enzyme